MTDGNAGMTHEALEALIGRMLDAEKRETPPPAGEEGDWLYGSAGFTEPDQHGWMAPLPSAHVWVPQALVFWHMVVRVGGGRGRGSAARSAPFAGALADD